MSAQRTTLQFGLLTLGAILTFAGLLATAVLVLRDRIDRSAEVDARRYVELRLDDERASLGSVLLDYALWDPFFEATTRQDVAWIYDNVAVSADEGTIFDLLMLLDGPFQGALAWTEGGGFLPRRNPLPADLVTEIREQASGLPPGQSAVRTGLIEVEGQLAILGVVLVQPSDGPRARMQPRDSLALMVGMQIIGPDDMAAFEATLTLSDLRFGQTSDPTRTSLGLIGFDGAPLGQMTWVTAKPGTEVIEALLPVFTAACIGFAAIAILAGGLARGNVLRLMEGQRIARAQALRDSLTELPNRLAMTEHLQRIEERGTGAVAVIYLDLNGFKTVNDRLGHRAGDTVVITTAARLRDQCRDRAFVARVGGDEFVAIIDGEGARVRAHDLGQAILDRSQDAHRIDGQTVTVPASVGIASRDRPDIALTELVRQADLAMLRAKRDRAKSPLAYSPEIEAIAARSNKLEAAMKGALARRGEFRVVYQPIVCARDGRLIQAEALARWTSPVMGEIGPQTFIPLAEASGMIGELGMTILDIVVQDLARVPGLSVSLNVSPLQLQDPDFIQALLDRLALAGVAAGRVEVELTESVLVDRPEVAAYRLDALHEAGLSTAIDDFGTGFSSLGYLRRMPFRTLKIDRSFLKGAVLQGAEPSRTPAELIAALVRLGHAMGHRTVCEGVETAEEAAMLAQLDCDLLQGYHFGRPMPLDDLLTAFPELTVTAA
jgi:diguanylate cyclase (GGDEF)-like protein